MKRYALFVYNSFMNITPITPYDDNKLKFDGESDFYVLTLEYAKAEFGNPYQDDEVMLRRLKKNSRKVYNFIEGRAYTKNKSVVRFLLNKTKQGREFIEKVLYEQFEADAESGFNDLSSMPAITPNSQPIDREQLYANQISVDAEQLIYSSASYFGVCLVSRTQFPWAYYLLFQEN